MDKVQLTKYGVAYDFSLSPYKVIVKYNDTDELEFVFSSELYRTKFSEKLENHRQEINESLSKRFSINIKNDKLSDIKLYTKVEKRGFLINKNDESYKCLNNIILDGKNLIYKS